MVSTASPFDSEENQMDPAMGAANLASPVLSSDLSTGSMVAHERDLPNH